MEGNYYRTFYCPSNGMTLYCREPKRWGEKMAEITSTTDAKFESDINVSEKLVIVDMWADWCGPCKMMEPVLEEIAKEHGEKVKVIKINIDQNQETPIRFNIMNIPTLLFFKDGKEVDRLIGAIPKKQLNKKIENYL
jgi:thioredoxin 1